MNTKVISLAIHKGGSGKSSITCNLAMSLSLLGKKVLVIDTDSQMNLSHSFNMYSCEKNFYSAFVDTEPLKDHIQKTEYKNIDIIIGDVNLARIDNRMAGIICSQDRVPKLIEALKQENIYDYILIDTNPTIASFNASILLSSDFVLIPVEPSAFGVEGLDIYLEFFEEIHQFKRNLSILGVVLNNVDKRKSLSDVCLTVIKDNFGEDLIFDTVISTDSNVGNAQWNHKPVYAYEKRTKVIKDYENLALEVIERINEYGA